MNSEEYKFRIAQPDVLDHTTLNVTLKELAFIGDEELASQIRKILSDNLIEKPGLHNGFAVTTNYYQVDLAVVSIERIIDLFNELEVSNLSEEDESTPVAAFYGALAEKWSMLG